MKIKILKKTMACLCVASLFFVLTKNLVKRHEVHAAIEQGDELDAAQQETQEQCEAVADAYAGNLPPEESLEKIYATERQKHEFFASIGCEYINCMDTPCKTLQTQDPKESIHYKADPQTVEEFSEKYRKDIQEKKLAPMFIKHVSEKVGYGIFATNETASGDFIGVYAGDIRPMRSGTDQEPEDVDYAWDYGSKKDDQDESGERLILDGKYRGNELRFINHAKDPNTKAMYLVVDGQLCVCYVAQKDISAGEQLTVSYGDDYWSTRNVQPESFI